MASASPSTSGLTLGHEDEMRSIHRIHLGKLNMNIDKKFIEIILDIVCL